MRWLVSRSRCKGPRRPGFPTSEASWQARLSRDGTFELMQALVFSGGGGRGAYELGVYKALVEDGYRPAILSGSSVGAITAAAICSGLTVSELETMWSDIGTVRVLRPRTDFWNFPRWTSLVRFEPLERFLSEHIDIEKVRKSPTRLRVTAVDVNTGELAVFRNRDITIDHLLASAAIPILFPIVEIDGHAYWDGGIGTNTPIGPAIEAGATGVTAVLLSPVGATPLETPRNLWDAITRTTEIQLLGALKEDIKKAEAVNRLIGRGLNDPRWRHVTFHIISPEKGLGITSILNFSGALARKYIARGHADGKAFLQKRGEHPVQQQAEHEIAADARNRTSP
ncbi:MAG: patatin-like phospholipase family protein [Thermoplasmatota archaeon]